MRRKERRMQVPTSAFSKAGLVPASLELVISKKLVTHLSPAEMRYQTHLPFKTHLPFHCVPKGTWKRQSGIRGKTKAFLSKALALKNVTKQLLPSCQPCYLAKVFKPKREKGNGVFLTLRTG